MKFLIVDIYYAKFLESFYQKRPALLTSSYQEQLGQLMAECFGTADFLSRNLRLLGHDAYDVVINCEPLQQAWAREHGLRIGMIPVMLDGLVHRKNHWYSAVAAQISRVSPLWWQWLYERGSWLLKVLAAQIEEHRPDILYVHAVNALPDSFLQDMKAHVKLIVGQYAAPLLPTASLDSYSLLISALPSMVQSFRERGINSEYLPLAFEPSVLKKLRMSQPRRYGLAFVGSLSRDHVAGNALLERASAEIEMDIWGQGIQQLPPESPVHSRYRGEAWGLSMYQVLANSKIALNRHIDMAGKYAANMRLYEATGVGAMLLTDHKENIHELFDPGREVVTYRDADECLSLAEYYLTHEDERCAIAEAGQRRTLAEHTYYQRMQRLVETIGKYL